MSGGGFKTDQIKVKSPPASFPRDRLFEVEETAEPSLMPEPRRAPARGVSLDARFLNDYPPEWSRCGGCVGLGYIGVTERRTCSACLGMGSVKARVRMETGFRCERCKHPYVPKKDAEKVDAQPSWQEGGWSACDSECDHAGPLRWRPKAGDDWPWHIPEGGWFVLDGNSGDGVLNNSRDRRDIEAAWRILTVHHLDGDKANLRWWNLAALCQRCHLQIQAKVVMERVYPHAHSGWFKPHAAGYYAHVYLGIDLTRAETIARLDELLALERV